MLLKLIIFDFDGTLVDTTESILWTYRATSNELGIDERTDAEYKATIGLPLYEGFKQLYPGFSVVALDNCVRTYRSIYAENKAKLKPRLYPGVKDTLVGLQNLGIKMTIASSRSNASLIEFCESSGLMSYFRMILGSDDVCNAKPDPEPVLKTLSFLKITPEETIVVGDMPVDMAMGRGAKCRTIGVTYGNSSADDLINAGASYVIDRITELIGIIHDCGIED